MAIAAQPCRAASSRVGGAQGRVPAGNATMEPLFLLCSRLASLRVLEGRDRGLSSARGVRRVADPGGVRHNSTHVWCVRFAYLWCAFLTRMPHSVFEARKHCRAAALKDGEPCRATRRLQLPCAAGTQHALHAQASLSVAGNTLAP